MAEALHGIHASRLLILERSGHIGHNGRIGHIEERGLFAHAVTSVTAATPFVT
ncbi:MULTISPECIES: hypothetical protein [unclassified Streptomyces]|uniref:hypothetical protein n=1 Tax=unclassified Streptomyces TaxID=2593676 RepID=UPI002E0D2188|nr:MULTISPECIES: hypothetical protein [unclassified Streptomyces]WSR23320.1 hypothetical protein OG573_32135 [Streptomyces sp. NBC_01205]